MEMIVERPRDDKIVVINLGRWFSSLRLRLSRNTIKAIQNSATHNPRNPIRTKQTETNRHIPKVIAIN